MFSSLTPVTTGLQSPIVAATTMLSTIAAVGYIVSNTEYYWTSSAIKQEPSIIVTATLSNPPTPQTLLSNKRKTAIVSNCRIITHDVISLEFEFPEFYGDLFMPVGKHVKIYAPNVKGSIEGMWNNRPDLEHDKDEIERKYTPTHSTPRGFAMVIKIYRPTLERFPDGGKMSRVFDSLKVGDKIQVELPFGLIEYHGQGRFKKSRQDYVVKNIGMVAGGSGITPMLRLIDHILTTPDDETKLTLLFANRTEADIIMREWLDDMANKYPHRFRVKYTLTRPSESWNQYNGLVSKEMLMETMPPPSEDNLILLCGPAEMVKKHGKENLAQLGYDVQKRVWEF